MFAKAKAAQKTGLSFVEVVTPQETKLAGKGELDIEVRNLEAKAESNDNQESHMAINAAINFLK